jgi:hypothetical protein
MKKNLKHKSRDIVTLNIALILPTIYSGYFRELGLFWMKRLRKTIKLFLKIKHKRTGLLYFKKVWSIRYHSEENE